MGYSMLDVAKIKSLREKRGLTQEQAAEKSGFGTRQRWNDVESGRKSNVSIDTLDKIAATLGVKAKDLLK